MRTSILSLFAAAALAGTVACGSSDSGGTGNPNPNPNPPGTPDAKPVVSIDGRMAALPSWKLKDVQPLSPRTGQTYGLDSFANKIVVVTLLEGF